LKNDPCPHSGQRNPLAGARGRVEVEADALTFLEGDRTLGQAADPQLRSLQVGENGDGAPGVLLDRSDDVVALLMVLMTPMAEVEAEHVGPGFEQRPDHLRTGACRSQGGDDFGIASAAHRHYRLASLSLISHHQRFRR